MFWVGYELVKDLDMRTSIVSHFAFPRTLSCFFLFLLIIDLHFLIPGVIAWIYNPIAGLVIPTGTATSEANAEIERQPLTAEMKTRKCSK